MLPFVLNLFRKARKIFNLYYSTVVKYRAAFKCAENLMLVGLDKLHVSAGGAVENGGEIHLKAPVIGGKGPRR